MDGFEDDFGPSEVLDCLQGDSEPHQAAWKPGHAKSEEPKMGAVLADAEFEKNMVRDITL